MKASKTDKGWGGPREGAGRKPGKQEDSLTEKATIRLTAEQRKTLDRLGAAWIRARLDEEAKKNPA